MNTVSERAYAKINLFLDVLARRSDGFHEIRSVMQTVSLFDGLTVERQPADAAAIDLSVTGAPDLPCDESNLVVRAASAFLSRIGGRDALRISLEKRIPMGAGLAGGSADAAATLRACQRLWGHPLTKEELLSLAAELGSDVPFCLIGGSALCLGRGEILHPLSVPPLYAVLVLSGERVSTLKAYAALDALYRGFGGSVKTGGTEAYEAFCALLSEGRTAGGLFNLFESAVLPTCPIAAAYRERLFALGALDALMSGSGSAVYGIFSDEASAKQAERILRAEGAAAFAVRSVG